MGKKGGSVARVSAALAAAGHPVSVTEFDESTRTAEEAAAAVGCAVAQIAKSLVFRGSESGLPVVVVASGAARVDESKVAAAIGEPIERADGRWVRDATGFAIGGVSPVGHTGPVKLLIDAQLRTLSPIWAAAGSPRSVFETTPEHLIAVSGATVAEVAV